MNNPTPGSPPPVFHLLAPTGWQDYTLLDTGNGRKLERYGSYTFIRPEPQAAWQPALKEKAWLAAHAEFQPTQEEGGGHWQLRRPVEDHWLMGYRGLKFRVQTTAGRHLGVFPEQAAHWDWMAGLIDSAGRPVRVLNLFGYTGMASLVAARAGASVTHVDASRKSLAWARENQSHSGLSDSPIRWIEDDALKFVQREGRRESRYDGILLDPPKFGRGPKGEVWEFFKLISELLESCRAILTPQPLFVIITAYAIRASALTLHYSLTEMMAGIPGNIETGELVLQEQSAGRLLSTAITSRWQAG